MSDETAFSNMYCIWSFLSFECHDFSRSHASDLLDALVIDILQWQVWLQIIVVGISTIAPASRWLLAINCMCSKRGNERYKSKFKVENHWTQSSRIERKQYDSRTESQPNPNLDLSCYVLHLEGEDALTELMIRSNCDATDHGFKKINNFPCQPPNCWALPVVTALAHPSISSS
ncbi:hypothetical protein ACFX13_038581 [Malus domestica]